MTLQAWLRAGAAALVMATASVPTTPVQAADNVTVGTVGSASANLWPVYIGINKGFFAAENLNVDLFFVQSSANLVQQLTAGSLNITMSTGLVDPIRAIDQGAPISIVRFEVQAPPYALMAKPAIKTLAELKGKTISVGGPKDITRIYVERMLAPHGVKPGEFDMVFAGATSARASALQAGAVDAAILLPPFNFHATAAGFNQLGLTIDYAKDLPFSGTVINRNWAAANQAVLQRLLRAHGRSVQWFYDAANRDEAVKMMVAVSRLKAEDVEKAYDFFRGGEYFERSGTISRKKLTSLLEALKTLGDVQPAANLDRFFLAGVAQVSD
jgi:ABC-type nitrate/sulfonate/bicarbonate transport system substrate-binding protein